MLAFFIYIEDPGLMKRRGILITFEGIDGTGKSTHLRLLARHLRRHGYRVTATREPGGTSAGEAIRETLLAPPGRVIEPLTELAWMYLARSRHIEQVIRPRMAEGRIVLSDRYNDASFAYQGYGRGLGESAVKAFDDTVCENVQPDLTLLLDLDPKAALQRTFERKGGKTRFEEAGLKFLRRVRGGYLKIARREPRRVKIVKAAGNVREVQEEIHGIVDRWLARNGNGLCRARHAARSSK
jgi:dTMP kinase